MDFKALAAGAALMACVASTAQAVVLIGNRPSVRTQAEACSLLTGMARGVDPFADRKTPEGAKAQKQAVGLAKQVKGKVCSRHKGEAAVGADGSQHFGRVVDGKPEGLGVRFYADGSRYIGDWKGGVRQGEGIGLQADGARYVGHFENDKPKGKGVLQYHAKISMTVADPNKPKP